MAVHSPTPFLRGLGLRFFGVFSMAIFVKVFLTLLLAARCMRLKHSFQYIFWPASLLLLQLLFIFSCSISSSYSYIIKEQIYPDHFIFEVKVLPLSMVIFGGLSNFTIAILILCLSFQDAVNNVNFYSACVISSCNYPFSRNKFL